jgi:hypothetical protein
MKKRSEIALVTEFPVKGLALKLIHGGTKVKKIFLSVSVLAMVLFSLSAWAAPFELQGLMTSTRSYHTATLLPNGKIMIAGGHSGSNILNIAEVYDPALGTFVATAGNMTSARHYHTATLLPNGKVVIVGGHSGSSILNTAEVYDPATGTFTATTGNMTSAR